MMMDYLNIQGLRWKYDGRSLIWNSKSRFPLLTWTFNSKPPTERPTSTVVNWASCLVTWYTCTPNSRVGTKTRTLLEQKIEIIIEISTFSMLQNASTFINNSNYFCGCTIRRKHRRFFQVWFFSTIVLILHWVFHIRQFNTRSFQNLGFCL